MKRFVFRNHIFPLGIKTYVMGILNVTPDSFSGDGCLYSADAIRDKVREMTACGADLIDIGANATGPHAQILTEQEELERLKIVSDVFQNCAVPLSVDTFYPRCADYALSCGASIINDISGCFHPELAALAVKYDAGIIITHNPAGISGATVQMDYSENIIENIRSFFENLIKKYVEAGLPADHICVDPGIGFSKKREQESEILLHISKLRPEQGCCVLCAASRKRIVGFLSSENEAGKRDPGTVAVHTAAIMSGADMIRVHDVFSGVQGAKTADSLFRNTGFQNKIQ